MKKKRINFEPGTAHFVGPFHTIIEMRGLEVSLRGVESGDLMASKPTVFLTPVDKKGEIRDLHRLRIPLSEAEELAQALLVLVDGQQEV